MEYPYVFDWANDSFFSYLSPFFIEHKIPIYGVLHIGAHTCEEKKEYNDCGIPDERILWIDGNKELCEKNRERGIPNVYNYLISDSDKEVTFHITNNKASSSIFPLSLHKQYYPHIVETEKVQQQAISLKTFFEKNNLNPKAHNVWVLDIQGAEYEALKGAGELIDLVDIIFTEVNFVSMYENITLYQTLETYLKEKGFRVTHIKNWQGRWGDAVFVREKYL